MREFNVTGLCVPEKHYMVDTSDNLKKITELITKGKYFVINRPRQYGKTTTLSCLRRLLKDEYIVVSISFERLGYKNFETAENFCIEFLRLVRKSLNSANISDEYKEAWVNNEVNSIIKLDYHIDKMCEDQKIVLMIDEVDKTSNNQVFLEFLSMLRAKYLARDDGDDYTFHSVILASVYNIKNIKLKLINEGYYTPQNAEGNRVNSPWNIAVEFNVDMSFNPQDIESMLKEYENETKLLMDTESISHEIYKYTSGYPFLVSYICKLIDEELGRNWSIDGVLRAVKIVLSRDNTLFDDLIKNIEIYKELYDLLYSILILGKNEPYNIDNNIIKLGSMFGFIKEESESKKVIISNKIFEIRISNYFISKDSTSEFYKDKISRTLPEDVIKNNTFDMELVLSKFSDHYREIYNKVDVPFLERHGRLLFLTFLKPLINGKGFYHIESQFTDYRRMDIVVDFNKDQFIIELKIWDGDKSREKAYDQLLDYMNSKNADKGYLLIFDFRKKKNKEQVSEWIQIGNKKIFSILV
ncbi:MAG: AAA-like domain-containing protein [Oscillospiraceae bacterium]|nr:AAA-like domain-containing protein [Oscillospiraceae bacterium]